MMNKNGFSRCGENYINRLRKEGRYSTAHVYKNALYSFGRYCGTLNVSFKQVTKERLRRYGQYLYDQKVLYIHKHGGYKLMELSSIHAELAALKKSVEEEYMKEKKEKREQAEKLKSKY